MFLLNRMIFCVNKSHNFWTKFEATITKLNFEFLSIFKGKVTLTFVSKCAFLIRKKKKTQGMREGWMHWGQDKSIVPPATAVSAMETRQPTKTMTGPKARALIAAINHL